MSVRGDIDMTSAAALMAISTAALATLAPGDRLTADLAGVTFIGAQGLNVLIRAVERARHHGATFRGTGCPPGPLRIAQVTATDRVLNL